MKSFGCMPAVRTPEASRTLTVSCPGILPSPLRDKVGAFHHDRFRGYASVHSRSGLHPPCLRFAAAVTGRHARLGTRLLARLCRGCHLRQLSSTRLQGATRTEPYGQLSCIRLPPRMFDGWPRPSVRAPASVTRFPGTVSGTCGIGSRSPWPPPFAPPPPLPVARLCSAASLLLWRSLTSHAVHHRLRFLTFPMRTRRLCSLLPDMRPLRFRRVPFGRDVAFDPGGATASRIAMPHMLPSTVPSVSASAKFFLSWLNPTPHPITVYASHPPSPTTAQHSLPGGALPPYRGRSFTGR